MFSGRWRPHNPPQQKLVRKKEISQKKIQKEWVSSQQLFEELDEIDF